MLVLGLKFKIQMAKNLRVTFWTSAKLTLNGPANGPEVTYSKIQNRFKESTLGYTYGQILDAIPQ